MRGARGRRHRAVVLRVERVQDLGQDGGDRRAGGQSFVAPPPFTAPAAHVDKMVGIDRPWVQHDRHLRLRRAVLFAPVAAGGAVRSDGSNTTTLIKSVTINAFIPGFRVAAAPSCAAGPEKSANT